MFSQNMRDAKRHMGSGFLGIVGLVCMALFAALLRPAIDYFDKGNGKSAAQWLFFSSLPLAAFVLLWAIGGDAQMWQKNAALGLIGAFVGASGFVFAGYALGQNAGSGSSPPGGAGPSTGTGEIVGHTIIGNGQGGAAEEIISNGSPGQPSTGADINIRAHPGQSVTGMRVIQNGSGTGLRVIQSGPGTGIKITIGQ